jgi:hypothetical protein
MKMGTMAIVLLLASLLRADSGRVCCQGLTLNGSFRVEGLSGQALGNGETVFCQNGDCFYVAAGKIVQVNASRVTVGGSSELWCGQLEEEALGLVGEPGEIYAEQILGDHPIMHAYYPRFGLAIDFWGGYVSRILLLNRARWERHLKRFRGVENLGE